MAKLWICPFKLVENTTNNNIASLESKAVVGLKILTTVTYKTSNSKQTIFQRNQIPSSSSSNSCFLKSCFLCHKHLSPNKDVYMYRGDQGFCSEECRNRQIYIDDIKELEISTKKMIQQFRQSRRNGTRCDTRRSHLSHKKAMASPIFF
ncbi:hypothetical protein CTI12_AA437280 [Artemisia annua]|uniref:FLZ-type domain-containing protein n=1 Tax=Artemisia annua TaxID=35608 RepID=A0A2U1LZ27_ARTAN|nr:hypothetical protein CTI12_AA437280 [Artemisia annua]